MQRYFRELRALSGETLDKYGIVKAFEDGISGCALPFRTVAEKFHFIDENTRTVYVPIGDGAALVEQLKEGNAPKVSTASWGAMPFPCTTGILRRCMQPARC